MIPVQVFFLIGHYIQVQSRHGPFSGFSSPYHSSLRTTPSLSRWNFVFLRILDIYRICPKIRLHFCVSLQEQLWRVPIRRKPIFSFFGHFSSLPLSLFAFTLSGENVYLCEGLQGNHANNWINTYCIWLKVFALQHCTQFLLQVTSSRYSHNHPGFPSPALPSSPLPRWVHQIYTADCKSSNVPVWMFIFHHPTMA